MPKALAITIVIEFWNIIKLILVANKSVVISDGIFPTNLFDIIKNRIQIGVNSNFRECCYDIYSKYGLIGFYRGFVPAIIRCIPTNAAYFYVIETIKSY